jgi:dihydropyrimidinase
VRGKPPVERLGALPEAIQAGYASVKMFTTNIRPNREGRMVQFGDIWEVLVTELTTPPGAIPESSRGCL